VVTKQVDTRTKIVPLAEAQRIAARGAIVVSGYFDPLLASHAERLQSLKREGTPLLVLIADPRNPILPARARAELVAGLAVVDHVVESGEGVTAHIRLEQEHGQRLDELIERVHARQRVAS
jgi:bifunctional ADP-heptose synthase (sugar kinase/adenylyltransferase)